MKITLCIPSIKDDLKPQLKEIWHCPTCHDVDIITSHEKVSASKNRNIVINNSDSEFIIMCDDDITNFYPYWVDELFSYWKDEYSILSIRPVRKDWSLCPILGDNGGKLPTAPDVVPALHTEQTGLNIVGSCCMLFKKTHIRFDTKILGATYDDTDFSLQHLKEFPDKKIMICNRVNLVHNMEAKGRGTSQGKYDNWIHNKEYVNKKWDCLNKYGVLI